MTKWSVLPSKADPGDDIGIGREIVVIRNRRFKLII